MSLAANADGKTFFTGDVSGRVCHWDIATGVAEPFAGSHSNQASVITVAGGNVVSAGLDDSVRVNSASTFAE